METRSAMAYWQNGKLYLHGSTQSVARTVAGIARWVGIDAVRRRADLRVHAAAASAARARARCRWRFRRCSSKKANAPVMMRISREEESYIGRARTNMTGRARVGFAQGRPHHRARPLHRPGQRARTGRWAIIARPATPPRSSISRGAMRWRGDQRDHQHAAAHAAAVAGADAGQRHHGAGRHQGGEAARPRSGGDPPHQLARRARRVYGPPGPNGRRPHVDQRVRQGSARPRRRSSSTGTSARRAAGSAQGTKVRGIGVAVGPHGAGSIGCDGLMTHSARRQAVRAVGRRQSRHAFGVRPRARRRRRAGDALGEGRGRLGQHRQAPAVDVPLGRQPDDARDDARESRGRDGREAEAAGDRREGSRRLAGRLRARQRARLPPRQSRRAA